MTSQKFNFEYDEEDSRRNKEKHGIDFEEAQELFNDPNMVIYELDLQGMTPEEFDKYFDDNDISSFMRRRVYPPTGPTGEEE